MFNSNPGQLQPLSASLCSDSGDLLIRSTRVHLRVQRQENTEPSAAPRPGRAPPPPGEEELQTIRLAAGGRGAGLEALRQRSQSAPRRREVRVTLLDSHDAPGQDSSSQSAPGQDSSSQSAPGQDSSPQSAPRQDSSPQSAPGQDSSSQSAPRQDSSSQSAPGQDSSSQSAPGAHQINMQRVAELTESVQRLLQSHRGQSLTEDTLQRLETLHNQQLTLQNQLLDSALKMVMRPAPQAPPPSHLSSKPSATPTAVPMGTLPVTVAPPTHLNSLSSANQSTEEVGLGASQILREMGHLRTELKSLFQQQQEPEKPNRTGPRLSPFKENKLKSNRTLQNRTRTYRTQVQSGLGTDRRPQHSRNQTKTRQPQLNKKQPAHNDEGHESYIEYLENRIRSQQNDLKTQQNQVWSEQNQQNQTQNHRPEEQERDEPQIHQNQTDLNKYRRYSENRAQVQKNDGEKKRNGSEEPKKQTQSEEKVVIGRDEDEVETQRRHRQKRQDGVSFKQNHHGPGLGGPGPVGPRSVLEGPVGPRSVLEGPVGPRSALEGPVGPRLALEEAKSVLRRVQRQRKLLDENLESQLRARTGDILHCQLNAIMQNRDCSDEVRIKKTVDSWIRLMDQDIQAELEKSSVQQVSAGTKASANRNAADRSSAPSGRGRPLSALRMTGSRTTTAKPTRTSAGLKPSDDPAVDAEQYLRRLYGKPPHEGQRRSLRRSPYLRLSSPVSAVSPDRSKPRPRLVESVRGVKLKSCKTQTSLGPGPGPGLSLGPGLVQSGASFPVTAIPLGPPRIGSSHTAQQEVTSPPRAPPPSQEVTSPPRAPPPSQKVTSPPKSAPQQEEKSAPGDVRKETEPESSPTADPPLVNILQSSPLTEEQEEVEFPGTHFLSVADLEQSDAGSEGQEVLRLEGGPGPGPGPVQYQGPPFPPQPPASALAPAQDQALALSVHGDALEDRLVQWVEQQLMSRIISEMYRPPLTDPTLRPHTDQSEPEEHPDPAQNLSSVQSEPGAASDLYHGDSGPQLLVESGLQLDEDLVRGLVHEVLTEIVARFLGLRESRETQTGLEPEPGPRTEPGGEPGPTESKTQLLVLTPEPTPVHTPTPPPEPQTPPLSPVATPQTTPLPSDRPSLKEDLPPEPVATPPPSPPVTCPDAEPPLVQDSPQQQEEPPAEPSVVPERPPDSSPEPHPPAPPSGPPSGPPSPSSPDASSSSVSSVSSVSSGTGRTVPKHISEGELLLSVHHLQALNEEGCSFSSSLQELQEMELDPPSEGQVRGRSVLLSVLTKLQQREPRPQPEGSWGRGLDEEEEVSAGEIRDVTETTPPTDHRVSPGQTGPTGDVLEWTNQSLLTSDLHMDLPLDSHLTQTQAAVSVHKQGSDLGLDLDQDTPQDLDQDLDLDLDQESPQRNGDGEDGGGVWGEGGAVMKVEVFVPSVEAESDSSSDVF